MLPTVGEKQLQDARVTRAKTYYSLHPESHLRAFPEMVAMRVRAGRNTALSARVRVLTLMLSHAHSHACTAEHTQVHTL